MGCADVASIEQPQLVHGSATHYLPWVALATVLHVVLLWTTSGVVWKQPQQRTESFVRVAIFGPLDEGERSAGAVLRGGTESPLHPIGAAQVSAPAPERQKRPERSRVVDRRTRDRVPRQNVQRSVRQAVEDRKPMESLSEAASGPQRAAASAAEGGPDGPAEPASGARGQSAHGSSGTGTDAGGRGAGTGGGLADARAYCVHCPAPVYPAIARQRSWSGVVRVWLELAADGTVRSARVESSSGYDALDREALAAARRSRFRVPSYEGTSAPAGVIEYRFELVP
ncbi:MAG: hypothetical protein KatS3mg077_1200 [Candidatus Binatia bacterium]|nr:MAG: hypothetical protein KatS3mg077_1200 [Candidatus Binatia bacterium]